MARTTHEENSALLALEDYLDSKGWTNLIYRKGWQPEDEIVLPMVTVTLPPKNIQEIEIGRTTGDRLFRVTLLVNAYMQTERQAQDVVDDIMDFMDLVCIEIKDNHEAHLGHMICFDTESIRGEVFNPRIGTPKVNRWRAAVTGPYDSFYPAA